MHQNFFKKNNNCDQLLSEDSSNTAEEIKMDVLVVCYSIIVIPLTVQPFTIEAPAATLNLVSSNVKCVVKKAYKQSGRGLGEQSDY